MARKSLRELVAEGRCVVAPGAHDAMTAQVIEAVGFEAVYLTGGGVATGIFGKPDVGLVTLTEAVAVTRAVVEAVNVPVIADGETGFGGLLNVQRTVQEFEHAGTTGIHIEDQVFPKSSDHLSKGALISIEEMEQKIRIATDSRKSSDFWIIARTEAAMVDDFDEALMRARAYLAAGADMIKINNMATREQIVRAIKEVPGRHMYNFSGTDKSPRLTVDELQELGYSTVVYPIHAQRAAMKSVRSMMEHLRQTGQIDPWYEQMITFDEWKTLARIPQVLQLEQRYRIKS